MAPERKWVGGGARGYKWESFKPGNQVALRHGADHRRVTAVAAERAELLHTELSEAFPFIHALDKVQVERYCRVEARAQLLHEWIMKVVEGEEVVPGRGRNAGGTGVAAVPPSVWTEATRADATAAKIWQEMGGDPTGRFRLLKDAGWVRHLTGDRVAELAERGRTLREQRKA